MFEESVNAIPSIWASMNSWLTPTVLFVLLNLMIGTIAITSSFGTQKQSDQQQQQRQPEPQQPARSPSVIQRLKSINLYPYRSPESTTRTFLNQTHQETETHFAFQETPPQPQLIRSPSVLERLKSINLYNYISQENSNPLHGTREIESHFQEQEEEQQQRTPEVEQGKEEEEKEEKEEIQDEEQTFDQIYSKLKGHRTYSDTKPASGEISTKLPKKMKKSASAKSAFAHFEEEDIVEARRPATVRERKPKVTEVDDEVDARADDFINKFKQQLKLQRIDSIRYKTVGRDTGK